MAKTKRTVEEAEVVAAAAASNDSKLITRGSLNHFATKFWDKIKTRYDGTFKAARLTEEKKLIFTKTNDTEDELDLREYARLKDKNEFKQDVSADNVAISNNSYMGSNIGFESNNRSLGFRQLTTSAFVDGYVDHIRIYVDSANANTTSTWKVWAITKGKNGKESDRVKKVVYQSNSLAVQSITENSVDRKFVIIPIEESFANETYFIARCSTHKVEVVQNIKAEYREDVVNLNHTQPPDAEDSEITWAGINADSNTAIMYLHGRESIGSLSLKLNKVSPDSGLYVKHSETTAVGGNGEGGKVVKLDGSGKLDKNMLPSIAINEYFEITEFTDTGLRDKTYENGDVVVVNNSTNINHGKKYLCIKKDKTASTNSTSDFIELNSKDGSVVSVNGKSGAVNLTLEAAADQLKLKIAGVGGATDAETSVPIVTDSDIDSIIAGLQD